MRVDAAWLLLLAVAVVGLIAVGVVGGEAPQGAVAREAAEAASRSAVASLRAEAGEGGEPSGDGQPSVSASSIGVPGMQIGVDADDLPPGASVALVLGPAGGEVVEVGRATADQDGRLTGHLELPRQSGIYQVGLLLDDGTVAGPRALTTEVEVMGGDVAAGGPPDAPAPPGARAPSPATSLPTTGTPGPGPRQPGAAAPAPVRRPTTLANLGGGAMAPR